MKKSKSKTTKSEAATSVTMVAAGRDGAALRGAMKKAAAVAAPAWKSSKMTTRREDDLLLSVLTNPKKGTNAMRTSLRNLYEEIQCHLCRKLLEKPVALPCLHTFCQDCIDAYVCNSWSCPVKSCGMPISMKGERKQSFRIIHPCLQTVVTSFTNICEALDRAPDHWWMDEEAQRSPEAAAAQVALSSAGFPAFAADDASYHRNDENDGGLGNGTTLQRKRRTTFAFDADYGREGQEDGHGNDPGDDEPMTDLLVPKPGDDDDEYSQSSLLEGACVPASTKDENLTCSASYTTAFMGEE